MVSNRVVVSHMIGFGNGRRTEGSHRSLSSSSGAPPTRLIFLHPRMREQLFPKQEYAWRDRRESTNGLPEHEQPGHACFCIEWWPYEFVFDEETQVLSDEPAYGGRRYGRYPAVMRAISEINDELSIVHSYRVA